MIRGIWGRLIGFGEAVIDKTGAVFNATVKSKRAWTIALTAGLKIVNSKLKLLDEATMNELVGLAVTAIVSDSIRPIGSTVEPPK